MSNFEEVSKGVVKRTQRRVVGLFIDGTGLDRATRRINRKVDMSALVKGVSAGSPPIVARYYTLIPNEDDSRQRAFLDAVAKAGMEVVVKRLPPKGVTRQVDVNVEMASDIIAFALGRDNLGNISSLDEISGGEGHFGGKGIAPGPAPFAHKRAQVEKESTAVENPEAADSSPLQRIVTVVCPSRDLSYTLALARELGADTVSADFTAPGRGDVLKSAAKWIDLSSSETIWRD